MSLKERTANTRPIFIFSLPRSGSTLLQKLLATSNEVASVAEPWVMLPLFSYDESLLTCSAYSSRAYRHAVAELVGSLPDGEKNLQEAARSYGMTIYEKLAQGKRYFLDKTPRYHLIANHLMETFPEAKFIFLWRNPLSVMASISRTWKNNRWSFVGYDIDLYEGQAELIRAYEKNKQRALAIRYEDFVNNPGDFVEKIETYLGMGAGSCDLSSISQVSLKGKMGDPTGEKEYRGDVSSRSVDRWRESFCNPFRKKYGISYLTWLGRERLEKMGYSMNELTNNLSDVPNEGVAMVDRYDAWCDRLKIILQSKIVKQMRKRKAEQKRQIRLD